MNHRQRVVHECGHLLARYELGLSIPYAQVKEGDSKVAPPQKPDEQDVVDFLLCQAVSLQSGYQADVLYSDADEETKVVSKSLDFYYAKQAIEMAARLARGQGEQAFNEVARKFDEYKERVEKLLASEKAEAVINALELAFAGAPDGRLEGRDILSIITMKEWDLRFDKDDLQVINEVIQQTASSVLANFVSEITDAVFATSFDGFVVVTSLQRILLLHELSSISEEMERENQNIKLSGSPTHNTLPTQIEAINRLRGKLETAIEARPSADTSWIDNIPEH